MADRETPATDAIAANCEAEAASWNGVEARAWIRRDIGEDRRSESVYFQSPTRETRTDSSSERRSSGLTRAIAASARITRGWEERRSGI
jgi:hypothetical protein